MTEQHNTQQQHDTPQYSAVGAQAPTKEYSAIKELNELTKIELWAFTGIISLALIFSFADGPNAGDIFSNYIFGLQGWVNLFFCSIITCIIYFSLVLFVERSYLHAEGEVPAPVFFVYITTGLFFILGMISPFFAVLIALRIFVIYLRAVKTQGVSHYGEDATKLFAAWLGLYAISIFMGAPALLRACMMLVAPLAILVYLQLLYVILPRLTVTKYPKWSLFGTSLLYTIFCSIIVGLIFVILNGRNRIEVAFGDHDTLGHDDTVALTMLCLVITTLAVVPVTAWEVYKIRNRRRNEEIKVLKTELGRSDASLNFLKSQINPHFLFNALNTLYGTALQEKAERTGEGIQMLGDMMRFMLQENVEDQIPLSRDIEYLNNYIALQKLRTSVSSDITIETQIEEDRTGRQIAPMILIPFVENAFKHGISLNNPSHIKITLQLTEDTLYFDVHNSLHIKVENDPERLQSGIGLKNVKQRLALQYPERHELIIRQNAREFFIHLTLQLKGNS